MDTTNLHQLQLTYDPYEFFILRSDYFRYINAFRLDREAHSYISRILVARSVFTQAKRTHYTN